MFLVAGARGGVGRGVVAELRLRGMRVRALSRSPGRVAPGLDAAVGDLAEPGRLDGVFAGVEAVSLPVLPGVDAAGVLRAARAGGVRRVVLVSSGAAAAGPGGGPVARLHAAAERAVAASGLEWTVLRPRWFASNALWWAADIRAGRPVRGAYPDAVTAPLHDGDAAAAVAAVLADGGRAAQTLTLTGPEVLTQAEQVRILGRVAGSASGFLRVGRAEARSELLRSVPAFVADELLDQQAALTAGAVEPTCAVRELTGLPARTFRAWALEHRDRFRTNRPRSPGPGLA